MKQNYYKGGRSMAKIITSPNVTFMDTTDNRKLDVYITSNLPTVQIKNSNMNPVAYTPNWASTPLVLEADAYLDSQDVNNKTTFSWYKKNALGVETLINANAQTITINSNVLDDGQLVVYVCKALYRASDADNGVEDFEQITFTQVTAGVNGQDGTSVTILGSYDTLSALQSAHPTGNAGDAYLVGGRLYVWAVDNREWEDVGNIQGPKGDTGVGIRSVTITYGVSDTSSTQPTSWQTSVPATAEGKYLWTRTVIDYTDDSIPDTVTYIYAKQGSKGDTGTAGSSVTVSSVQYQEGTSATVAPTGTWSNTVVTAAEGKYLWTKTTFSDGKTAYGVAKQGVSGKDGVGINSTTVDYGVSDSATARPTSWQQDIPVVAEGQYLWTRTVIDYTDASKADTVTYTYAKQGAKGDTGVAGSSVTVSSIQYQEGASATTAPTGTWSPVVVAVAEGKYLWTKTVFSDGKIAYGVAKQGAKGKDGVGISSITVDYGVSDNASTKPTTWQQSIPVVAEGKYLWTRTITDYTDTSVPDTVAYVYAKQGIKGETGVAGSSVTVSSIQYQAGTSATTAPTGTWADSVVAVSEGNYLWTKTTFSDGKIAYGVAKQGRKGDKGADAYTVLLTNESHVFAGSVSAAIASSATTQVLAYNAATSQSVTIVSVNGVAASTASTATGIAGLSFQCSALSGTSPTITFTCTTSFVSANGTIPIVIKVGSISVTKMFTYSIAFKGATGGQGNQGNPGSPATSYWLMSSASVVQKSASGTVVLTPSTLTFTGKSQTGTSTPIDYGCRWIIAYSTDGSTYTNAYTSTANETTKTFTVDSTYKAIRVRMYLAGGTTTLLDEQIIPVVADGAIGTPGTDAVTFQVYSSNGYALSINTPTVTLQTFAYIGDIAITAGATYQWYIYNDTGWSAISGGTNAYLTITREDVAFSKSYMCKMTFGGVEYTSVATIDDKNDENKVFTTKPSNYAAGDLWVVGVDYAPAGVAVGTLLRAEHTNVTYGDVDWVTATKYDKELNDLKDNIETYNQYFSFDSTEGLKISAKDNNGTPSQFSTSLTNERLSFNYGNEAIAYINGTKMNIKEAEIESPLTVTGKYSGSTMLQAPVINIGNFSIIVESNGSLSIVANT